MTCSKESSNCSIRSGQPLASSLSNRSQICCVREAKLQRVGRKAVKVDFRAQSRKPTLRTPRSSHMLIIELLTPNSA